MTVESADQLLPDCYVQSTECVQPTLLVISQSLHQVQYFRPTVSGVSSNSGPPAEMWGFRPIYW